MSRKPEPTVALGSAGVAGKGPEENEVVHSGGLSLGSQRLHGQKCPSAAARPEAPRKARVCAREDVCACVVIMGHFQNVANGTLHVTGQRQQFFGSCVVF